MTIDRNTNIKDIQQSPAYIIHRTARLLRVSLKRSLEAHGLNVTTEQWFVLFRVYNNPGCSVGELADKDLVDYPNLSRQVEGLVKKGLVERRPDPKDRRRSYVFLTVSGTEAMTGMMAHIPTIREQLFEGVSAEAVEAMIDSMVKIQTNIIK